MKKSLEICLFLGALLLFPAACSPVLEAAEQQESSLFEMPFEQLMTVSVEAVSKRKESLAYAPGIASVLTREDIKNLGVHTVADAVAFMPGIFHYDSYVTPFNQLSIRNNFGRQHFNSKVLFTVNGHPTYYPAQGAFEVNSIPINAIEKIELVRGPASVLYGTNALTGVINIITRKKMPDAGCELRYQYGSFETHEARFTTAQTRGDLRYFLAAAVRDQDGYTLRVKPEQDESGRGLSHRHYMNYTTLFLTIAYKDFEVDVSYFSEKNTPKIGLLPDSSFRARELDKQQFYIDARYTHRCNSWLTLHGTLRYDYSDRSYRIYGLRAIDPDAHDPAKSSYRLGLV